MDIDTQFRIVYGFIGFLLCVLIINSFTMDVVPAVFDNKGNIIAKLGMTKDEIISKLGVPPMKDEQLKYESCFCYPVSFQRIIKSSFWRNHMFSNYLKVSFGEDNRAEEIYFYGHGASKGEVCSVNPKLGFSINREPYR